MNSGILAPHSREGNQFTELRRRWFEGIKLNVDKFDCKYGNNDLFIYSL